METLDPRVHDPEEYEGKGVTIGGCPYEVGALVGSGASKFVHLLRNRRSGLHVSVLAIFRDAEETREQIRNEIAAKVVADLLGGPLVPRTMEVSLPGGWPACRSISAPTSRIPTPGCCGARHCCTSGSGRSRSRFSPTSSGNDRTTPSR